MFNLIPYIGLYTILHTFIEAFLAGLTLSLLIGPAFFTLLQTSLAKGFKPALRFALGIFLSDAFLVSISFLGASRLFTDPSASKVIGVVGGIILMLIGVYTFRKKVQMKPEALPAPDVPIHTPRWRYFFKGFFMNMANPGTWIFWFVSVGTITAQYTTDEGYVMHYRVIFFFLVTLLTVFSMDTLKAFVAHKIKRLINERTITIVNKVVGVLLFLFGIYLFVSTFIPMSLDSVKGML